MLCPRHYLMGRWWHGQRPATAGTRLKSLSEALTRRVSTYVDTTCSPHRPGEGDAQQTLLLLSFRAEGRFWAVVEKSCPLGGKYTALSRDDKITRNKLHKPRWVTPAGFAVGSGGGAVLAALLDLEGVARPEAGHSVRVEAFPVREGGTPSKIFVVTVISSGGPLLGRSREILPARR